MPMTLTHAFVCDLRRSVNAEIASRLPEAIGTAVHKVQLIVIDENGTEIGLDDAVQALEMIGWLLSRRADVTAGTPPGPMLRLAAALLESQDASLRDLADYLRRLAHCEMNPPRDQATIDREIESMDAKEPRDDA